MSQVPPEPYGDAAFAVTSEYDMRMCWNAQRAILHTLMENHHDPLAAKEVLEVCGLNRDFRSKLPEAISSGKEKAKDRNDKVALKNGADDVIPYTSYTSPPVPSGSHECRCATTAVNGDGFQLKFNAVTLTIYSDCPDHGETVRNIMESAIQNLSVRVTGPMPVMPLD